jgi:hypothetical protein
MRIQWIWSGRIFRTTFRKIIAKNHYESTGQDICLRSHSLDRIRTLSDLTMILRPFPPLWLPILLLSPAAAGRYESAKTSLWEKGDAGGCAGREKMLEMGQQPRSGRKRLFIMDQLLRRPVVVDLFRGPVVVVGRRGWGRPVETWRRQTITSFFFERGWGARVLGLAHAHPTNRAKGCGRRQTLDEGGSQIMMFLFVKLK